MSSQDDEETTCDSSWDEVCDDYYNHVPETPSKSTLSAEARIELIDGFCRKTVEVNSDGKSLIKTVKAGAKGRRKKDHDEVWDVGHTAAQYGLVRTWVFGIKAVRFLKPKNKQTRKMKKEAIAAAKDGFEARRERVLQEYADAGLDIEILRLVT